MLSASAFGPADNNLVPRAFPLNLKNGCHFLSLREISATYRLVSYLLADNWLICMLRPIHDFQQQYQLRFLACDGVFVVIFSKTMYNKTIIRFRFCDILNNQSLGKCYQPQPSARLTTLTSTLIIPDITKTSSNNCILSFDVNFSSLALAESPPCDLPITAY